MKPFPSLLLLALVLVDCAAHGPVTMPDTGGEPIIMHGTGSVWPIDDGANRQVKLSFGMYVTPDPKTNPIDPPERFTGYHVGTDFETTPAEAGEDVRVYAICDGTVTRSGFTAGYGGLITEECVINNEKVTVLYGHLKVDSLPPKDAVLTKDQQIGLLGAARSHDTDGNRKHLHLGIVKGWSSDVNGYVQTEGEMKLFVNPQDVLPL